MGTVLEYNCDPSYLLDGPSILTCSAEGHWSSEPPRCLRSDGKDKTLQSTVNHNYQSAQSFRPIQSQLCFFFNG